MQLAEVTAPKECELESTIVRNTIVSRIFSFPVLMGALLVVLTVLTVRERFNDPDMWWHLRVGEIVWNTGIIPTSDTFSFTTNSHGWIPHEWLAELAIYGAYHLGGYPGLMVWLCVLPSTLLVAIFTLCSMYSGNCKIALLGALAAWLFTTVGLAIRPHVIGYLLLTLQLVVFHLGRYRNRRWFLLLPVIFAVWVNCHGSFVFGLGVLAVHLICSFVDFRMGLLVSKAWNPDTRRVLGGAIVLSLLALFLNPVGLKQVIYPLDVMLNQSTNLAAVAEWQPPSFTDPRDFALIGIGGLIVLIPLLRRIDLRLEELLLVAMVFGMALRHSRMMFVFGILVAPVLSRLLADTWDKYECSKDRVLPNAVLLAVVIASVIAAFPQASALQRQVEDGNPVKAIDFMRRNNLPGRMLNEYVYGGYFIWADPNRKVFIDGRADIFDWTGVLREYGAWATLQADPATILNKYDIQICVLSAGAPIAKVLRYLPAWDLVYSDRLTAVFARKNGDLSR